MADDQPGDGNPVVDGRRRDDLVDYAERVAPYYTDEWDPTAGGPGRALLEAFADLGEGVLERLDRLPGKHRLAFLDELGFDRLPPQDAAASLAVTVKADAPDNVRVPGGTRAVAAATESRPEQTFEVPSGSGIEATPARLDRALSVDPREDLLFEHGGYDDPETVTGLFRGAPLTEDEQDHLLRVGDADALTLQSGSAESPSTLRVECVSNAPAWILRNRLVWEYYGETEVDGEAVEGWHTFERQTDWFPFLWVSGDNPIHEVDVDLGPLFAAHGYDADVALPELFAELGRRSPVDLERLFDALGYRLPTGDVLPLRLWVFVEFLTRSRLVPEADWRFAWADASESLRRQLAATVLTHPAVADGVDWTTRAAHALDFRCPGTLTETTLDGVESRWIRCRVASWDPAADLFDLELAPAGGDQGGHVRVGPRADRSLATDAMLYNDVPLPTGGESGDVHPLGTTPRPQDAFYVASSEAFTKADRDVEVTFHAPSAGTTGSPSSDEDMAPTVSWEYWNGSGWARIDDLDDGTDQLTAAGPVAFPVPSDLEATAVAGHEGHWIRARLVGGAYGQVTATRRTRSDAPDEWTSDWDVDPPRYGGVSVEYAGGASALLEPAEHLTATNNLAARDLSAARGAVAPFRGLPDEAETLYLGFDRALEDGPITLLVSVTDRAYPRAFYPRVRWEYCTDPGRDEWTRLPVEDGTEGLTRTGVVRFTFPEPTEATERFGTERHWIRARVAGDPFGTPFDPSTVWNADASPDGNAARTADTDAGSDPSGSSDDGDRDRDCRDESLARPARAEPCGATVRTAPPGGGAETTPPELRGLFPNAVRARNVRSVDDEPLGASDGTPDQEFAVSSPPVLDATVWVDESQVRSEGERAALREESPERVRVETGPSGDVDAFWVRWERVADLLDSTAGDRHYTLDRVAGRIAFGDGDAGMIPPRGSDNVRASYRTGGGAAGNVERGAIGSLTSSVALVEEVTNPLPADGGADAESSSAVESRAPKRLRDRGRAVAAADYERIAAAASRKLARTRCLPAMDADGERTPGWVTVLVVPAGTGPKPTPSASLEERVRDHLAERAPLTLVDGDRLVVRGPSYVRVSVDASVVAEGVGSVSALEERARAAVAGFLHPLTGGPEGEGWPFGDLPCPSDLYALLEGVEGVDHVEGFELTVAGSGAPVTVDESGTAPDVSQDALVYGGEQDVTVRAPLRADGDGGEGGS